MIPENATRPNLDSAVSFTKAPSAGHLFPRGFVAGRELLALTGVGRVRKL
jgi:hypothetical protein